MIPDILDTIPGIPTLDLVRATLSNILVGFFLQLNSERWSQLFDCGTKKESRISIVRWYDNCAV